MSKKKSWGPILMISGVALLLCCGGVAFVGNSVFNKLAGVSTAPAGQSFEEWRDANPTVLVRKAPAPQDYQSETVPTAVAEVRYQSSGLSLKAWVRRPDAVADSTPVKHPGLVFLHGGFAFGSGDLDAVNEAVSRGFVVMAPMLRGENGNLGNFELFRGEVDDAAAAAKWLSEQDYIDPNRVYAFGHSVGGGVSAMLSLLDDVVVQHSGSSGGLYPPSVFLGWADIVPFEPSPIERGTRLLVGNIRLMKRPHYAYLGTADSLHDAASMAKNEMAGLTTPKLTVEMVAGDHFSSFDGSLSKYLDQIETESGGRK